MNYINLDIESSNKPHASGIITKLQIKMNNLLDLKQTIVEAQKTYNEINDKIKNVKGS